MLARAAIVALFCSTSFHAGCERPAPCDGVPQLNSSEPSGLEQCGFSAFRRDSVPCESTEDGDCTIDEDCGQGQACLCAAARDAIIWVISSTCVEAECRTDRDCGDGRRCGLSSETVMCGTEQVLACQTDKDLCDSSDECEEGKTCQFEGNGDRWECRPSETCVID